MFEVWKVFDPNPVKIEMDARNCFFGFQIVSGVSNKPFPTYFGAVMTAEHVFENVLKCFKITIFKLENRISMINSRSVIMLKNYADNNF